MLTILILAPALALPLADLQARLDEVASLRSQRILDVPAIPASAYEQAAAGQIAVGLEDVPGHKAKKAWGVGVFAVGIEQIWAGLNDETQHVDISAVGAAEVVRGRVCEDHRRVFMYLPIPLLTDRWWINENTYNTALYQATGGRVRELVWRSVDPASQALTPSAQAKVDAGGVPIASSEGAWLLIALDDTHTLGEYYVWTDPGGSIPAGIASKLAAGGIEDTYRDMEAYARDATLQCLGR